MRSPGTSDPGRPAVGPFRAVTTMTNPSATRFIDSSSPVREGEELDVPMLEAWLQREIPGSSGPLAIEQFPVEIDRIDRRARKIV